ncbi:MAG TPA: RNA polymerase sigma factor region1.1 domain-containing protein [Steroidobacteraceae bacterium]|nr:RNA polymerase sigma factor region1.1 domain-containing protein [Steroidobacteraceae bacterium]
MQAPRPSTPKAPAFQFSLHVRHPSIDPAEISHELQLVALESFQAGQPRASRSGVAVTAVHSETYWVAVIDPARWPGPPPLPPRAAHPARAGGGASELLRPAQDPLPPDRHSRLKLLVQLGKRQGHLLRGQVEQYLPAEVLDPDRIDEVILTLAEMGIGVVDAATEDELRARMPRLAHEAHAMLASLTPHEAKVLRARFGLDVGAAGGVRDLGAALALVCESLVVRHGTFLRRLHSQGGSVTLQVTLPPEAQGDFRLTPQLGHWLAELGITLEFEFAGEPA